MTEEERSLLLPSDKQLVINNRVGWARTFLKKAGMLHYVRRGVTQITSRGTEFLSMNTTTLTIKDFKKHPDYEAAWANGVSSKNNGSDDNEAEQQTRTPEERIDEAYDELTKALSASIMEQISQMLPAYFERLVVDLLLKLGYGGNAAVVLRHQATRCRLFHRRVKFMDDYIATRSDVKPLMLRHLKDSRRCLTEYFGEDKPLDEITPGEADEYRRWLLKSLGENTVRRRCGRAKQFFRAALPKRLARITLPVTQTLLS